MFSVFQDNSVWMIVRNLRVEDFSGISGTRQRSASRTRHVYDQCWTGKGWAGQRVFTMKFASGEAAQEYLEANYEQIAAVE